jgi:hypothetical protein
MFSICHKLHLFYPVQLLPGRHAEQTEEFSLFVHTMVGKPPPLPASGDDFTLPQLRSKAVI